MGMDQAALHTHFSRTAPPVGKETSGGYGIRNIQERLILAYGAPYGLSCVSQPGKGTVVTVQIPVISPIEDSAPG